MATGQVVISSAERETCSGKIDAELVAKHVIHELQRTIGGNGAIASRLDSRDTLD